MKTCPFLGHDLVLLQQDDPPSAAVHIGERTLEVPMAWAFLRELITLDEESQILNLKSQILEVGAVLPYHQHRPGAVQVRHRVIDPYDPWPPCDRRDALDVDYTGCAVLSISTIEHIGLLEYGATADRPLKGFAVLEKILTQARSYFVTFPLGYNLQLDAAVAASAYPRQLYVQTSPYNTWAPAPTEDWAHAYGRPYPWANAICVLSR